MIAAYVDLSPVAYGDKPWSPTMNYCQ